ncbi:alpha-(1,3)-fucosyltransferase C-like [Aphomia sociella]
MYATLYVPGKDNSKIVLFDLLNHENAINRETNALNDEELNNSIDKEDKIFEEENSDDDEYEELLERKIDTNTKYILQWYRQKQYPFLLLGTDDTVFSEFKCPYTNCILTDDHDYLPDITDFHAVLFQGSEVDNWNFEDLPTKRSMKQKYVFAATESAYNNPINNPMYDNFFNWTWTYKLNSEIYWGYITIYDLHGDIVGPKLEMNWPEMEPIGTEIENILNNKSKAAAWYVSNCNSKSNRDLEVANIQVELEKIGWSVDIYGKCGQFTCPRNNSIYCYELIRQDYYFYFAFENSFAEDYVTENLLHALNNYAVPIVFGEADYSRFLPPGSYLNARELGPEKLAKTMGDIINNKTSYYDFFRWRNHFVYKETIETDDLCNICTALNDEEKFNAYSLYENFRKWWNEYQ